MFCLPNDSHQSNDPRSPSSSSREVPSIEIEAPADTLKTLLDMVTGESDQPITSEEGVYALGSVIFLAKKYGFDIAYRFILIRLKSHRNAFPWAVFSVASHIKETSLARSAIPYFISDPNLHVDKVYGGAKGPWRFESPLNKISADYYRQCQPDYFFLLVRAMMRYETMVYECTTPPQNGYDWSDVRRNFGRFEDSSVKITQEISANGQRTEERWFLIVASMPVKGRCRFAESVCMYFDSVMVLGICNEGKNYDNYTLIWECPLVTSVSTSCSIILCVHHPVT